MNILADLHQTDLFYSLQLLFEKRLGYSLFRPIGLDWYKEGFWKVYDNKDTAEQYLGTSQGYQPKDGSLPLNNIKLYNKFIGELYICEDKHNNSENVGITFGQFKNMPIDIVIASIPAHVKPFKELAKMKNAKFIFQMGNVFPEVNLNEIPNLMANTLPSNIPPSCNYVQYHQEFDLDIFKPLNLPPEKKIVSFINIYQNNKGFEDFINLSSLLLEYDFKSYGGQCRDGSVPTTSEMAMIMNKSAYGFHSKYMGDGYGHVLYNWLACGKPVITRISDYKGKMGEELLEDRVTCLDIDKYSMSELQYIITNLPPIEYEYMTKEAYKRFQEKVSFDLEEQKIRKFLDNLQ